MGDTIMLNLSLPGEPSSPKNRRRSLRDKPNGDDVVTVYSAEGRWPAIIVDQSEGGFGLAVNSDAILTVGTMLRVTSKQQVLKGQVVSRRDENAGAYLGVKLV